MQIEIFTRDSCSEALSTIWEYAAVNYLRNYVKHDNYLNMTSFYLTITETWQYIK